MKSKGKVKSIKEFTYKAFQKPEEIQIGNIQDSIYESFDKNGKIIKSIGNSYSHHQFMLIRYPRK